MHMVKPEIVSLSFGVADPTPCRRELKLQKRRGGKIHVGITSTQRAVDPPLKDAVTRAFRRGALIHSLYAMPRPQRHATIIEIAENLPSPGAVTKSIAEMGIGHAREFKRHH